MAICLLCHSYFDDVYSWNTLFSLSAPDPVCVTCDEAFEKITGEVCVCCGRPFSSLSNEYRAGDYCYDCIRWQQDARWSNVLVKNRSVYLYNDFSKDIIALFKFRGDYIISEAFRTIFKKAFRKHFNSSYLPVPIPLSDERLYERGFNQAFVLAQMVDEPICEVLSRTHLEKQSKKSRAARIDVENIFQVVDKTSISNKDILLIDDIYTTGSTLRHAAEILLQEGAKSVSSLTLFRG